MEEHSRFDRFSNTTTLAVNSSNPSLMTSSISGPASAWNIAFNHLKKRLRDSQTEVKKLKQERSRTSAELTDVKELLNLMENEKAQLESIVRSKNDSYEKLEDLYTNQRVEMKSVEKHSNVLFEKVKELSHGKKYAEDELQRVSDNNKELKTLCERLGREKKKIEEELESLKNIPEITVAQNSGQSTTTLNGTYSYHNNNKTVQKLISENKTLKTNLHWLSIELSYLRKDSDSSQPDRLRPPKVSGCLEEGINNLSLNYPRVTKGMDLRAYIMMLHDVIKHLGSSLVYHIKVCKKLTASDFSSCCNGENTTVDEGDIRNSTKLLENQMLTDNDILYQYNSEVAINQTPVEGTYNKRSNSDSGIEIFDRNFTKTGSHVIAKTVSSINRPENDVITNGTYRTATGKNRKAKTTNEPNTPRTDSKNPNNRTTILSAFSASNPTPILRDDTPENQTTKVEAKPTRVIKIYKQFNEQADNTNDLNTDQEHQYIPQENTYVPCHNSTNYGASQSKLDKSNGFFKISTFNDDQSTEIDIHPRNGNEMTVKMNKLIPTAPKFGELLNTDSNEADYQNIVEPIGVDSEPHENIDEVLVAGTVLDTNSNEPHYENIEEIIAGATSQDTVQHRSEHRSDNTQPFILSSTNATQCLIQLKAPPIQNYFQNHTINPPQLLQAQRFTQPNVAQNFVQASNMHTSTGLVHNVIQPIPNQTQYDGKSTVDLIHPRAGFGCNNMSPTSQFKNQPFIEYSTQQCGSTEVVPRIDNEELQPPIYERVDEVKTLLVRARR